MKKNYLSHIGGKLFLPFWILSLLLLTSQLHAQTANISYIGTSLSGCNVFNPPVYVGGKVHNSHAGAVTFASGQGIRLNTIPFGATAGGTAYYISYNFIPGNVYSVSVTTSGGDNQVKLNTSVIPNLSNYVSSNTAGCNGTDPFVNGYVTSGFSRYTTTVAPTTTAYNIPSFQVTGGSPYPYLFIWSSGGNPNLTLDGFYISSIVITQVTASFPVSPATVNVTCGTALTQTFTASNPFNIPGIVSYTWNLGAVPNGWNYNGSAAPASVTTAANTIALTAPAGGTLPKPISLTVNLTGSTTVAGANGVTVALNPFSISGTGPYLCPLTGVYSIANLNYAGATVNWSLTPAGAASLSCTSCASTTLTRNYPAAIVLSATITNGCSATPVTVTKNIALGSPDAQFTYSKNGACNGPTQSWFLSISPSAATNIHWVVTALGNGSSIYLTNPYSNATYANVIGGGGVTVYYTDLCGLNTQNGATIYSTCGSGHGLFSISPNPASSTVTVASVMEAGTSVSSAANATKMTPGSLKSIDQIKIMDKNGRLVKTENFATGTSSCQINVSNLQPGIYIIEIKSGTEVVHDKIIVSK
jgi:hypothetical protein